MYIPHSFAVEDRQELEQLMRRFSFATLVTVEQGLPVASHIPILHQPAEEGSGTLLGHLARANQQWRSFEQGRQALVIFQGPHAYISPSWYSTSPSVPTWNYMAIHGYGVPRIIEDHDRVVDLLQMTVSRFESHYEQPWSLDAPEEFLQRQVQAIVAFEMPLERVEGKFKLSQNRPAADQAGVVAALQESDDPTARDLAEEMRRLVLRRPTAS